MFVAKPFQLIMHLAAYMVLFPSSAITIFVILLQNCFQKFVMMFTLPAPDQWDSSIQVSSACRWCQGWHQSCWPASGVVVISVFFDVCSFNVFAESNQSSSLAATFCKHEGEKLHAYEEHEQEVERGNFTPLAFSSSEGMGEAAMVGHCRLTNLLSDKWNSLYPLTMGRLQCSLSFSLLRSSLMCLCGSHSSSGSPSIPAAIDLVVAEGHLATSCES